MKIHAPHLKIKALQVLENVLQFDDEGFAPADHLTDEEVARCHKFGLKVEGKREKAPDKPPAEKPAKGKKEKAPDKPLTIETDPETKEPDSDTSGKE